MRGKILALIDNDSGQLCKKLIRLIIINMTILVKGRISMNIDDSVPEKIIEQIKKILIKEG